MTRAFTAIYEKRGKWIIAYVEELPGVNTQGRSMAEARRNLKEAIELIMDTNRILARSQIQGHQFVRETVKVTG